MNLFIGNLNSYSRSYERYLVLKNICDNTVSINTAGDDYISGISSNFSIISRVFNKIGVPFDESKTNSKINSLGEDLNFQLIWIEKTMQIRPSTIRRLRGKYPNSNIVLYTNDNLSKTHNQSFYLINTFKYFDLIVTVKPYSESFFYKHGAKKVLLVERSHSCNLLNKVNFKDFKYDVVFIGRYEKQRADDILYLTSNGVCVNIWGSGWNSVKSNKNLIIHGKPVWGGDYIDTVLSSKIVLNFLRKINNDVTTGRTFEIPALGGFMLSEFTIEQRDIFHEGVHACYFGSKVELLDKVRYYLKNDKKRENIAKGAKNKALSKEFCHESVISCVLDNL